MNTIDITIQEQLKKNLFKVKKDDKLPLDKL